MQKYVDIDVQPDGTMKVDAVGFKGKECERGLPAKIAKELGTVQSTTRKPEYFQGQQNQAQH